MSSLCPRRLRMIGWRVVATLAVVGAAAVPVAAEEAKTPVSAPMLLNILSAPLEPREVAYDESIKDEGPAAPQRGFVLQPDGSLRYGSETRGLTVTVKNPCPPGTDHYEPPPLPGRRRRN
jgi:hypothetical protein